MAALPFPGGCAGEAVMCRQKRKGGWNANPVQATGFKLMLDAHMDEIGFMVQHIDEKGFISFTPIGGWDTRLLPGHMLSVAGRGGKTVFGVIGTHPPHIQKAADVPGLPAQRCPSIQGKGPAITVDDGIRLHPAATIL